MILNYEVKQLATLGVLHYEIELFWCLDDFIKLNDVRVSDHFQDVDFTGDSLNVVYVLYLVFFQDLNCYFLAC